MKRLVDESLAPELHDLLRSAEEDAPPLPERREDRIIAAVAAASTAGGAVTTAVSAAGTSRPDGLVRIAKWTAPLLGVVAAATFAIVSRSAAVPDDGPGAAVPASEVAPREDDPPPATAPATATATGVRVEDLPTATAAAPQRPIPRTDEVPRGPTPNSARPAPASEPEIDAEITAIDGARAALTGGRPAEALAKVTAYRGAFAELHFADEADAIEIQALAALGRKDEARRKAAHFLATRARSPYAQRVRAAAELN